MAISDEALHYQDGCVYRIASYHAFSGSPTRFPLLNIWPFFHAVGVMLDFSVNIGEVALVSAAFPWAVGALALMVASGALLVWLVRRRVG